jgi:hypothetical protein
VPSSDLHEETAVGGCLACLYFGLAKAGSISSFCPCQALLPLCERPALEAGGALLDTSPSTADPRAPPSFS